MTKKHISLWYKSTRIQRKADFHDNSIQANIKLSPDSSHPVLESFLQLDKSWPKFLLQDLTPELEVKELLWLHTNKTQAIYLIARESNWEGKWVGTKIGFLSIGRGLRHFEDESTHVWRNPRICIGIKTRCKQWATKANNARFLFDCTRKT